MKAWEILSEIVRVILMMSVTGSVISLILFVLKPFIKNRVPKATQYYIWLLVIAAFLVPISSFVTLPVNTPLEPIQKILEANVISTAERQERLAKERYNMPYEDLEAPQQIDISFREIGLMKGELNNYILFALITMGGVVFLIDIGQYLIYISKLRRRRLPARKSELELLPDNTPRLYRNSLATTPMLVGLLRPIIYLPDNEYTETQLRNILHHELTHWRRHDAAVKWLVALAVHVHWFNPIVYLMRREIDRACELACDEAVIKEFDANGKQSYGDTLIDMAKETKKPKMIVSTTMCEEKKALKERLAAIMKSKKHTRLAVVLSTVLVVAVCGTAVALGAGSGGNAFWKTPEILIAFPYDKASDVSAEDVKELILSVLNNSETEIYIDMTHCIHLEVDYSLKDLTFEIVVSELNNDGNPVGKVYQISIAPNNKTMRLIPRNYEDPVSLDYYCKITDFWNALSYLPIDAISEIDIKESPAYYSLRYTSYDAYTNSSPVIKHVFYNADGIMDSYRESPSVMLHFTPMYQDENDPNIFEGIGMTILYYYTYSDIE